MLPEVFTPSKWIARRRVDDHAQMQGAIDAVGEHLNAARRAVYANVGPSPVLVEIRAAMDLLGIKEESLRTVK